MMRALIVDDETHAREEIALLLDQEPDIAVIGSCANAIEALKCINRDKPDIVFLDIQMPRISGMELIGMLDPEDMPRIVFVTAFDEYAVAAFDENAFDYLLKPIERDRFDKTLTRLRKANGARPPVTALAIPALTQIPCFLGNRIRIVRLDDVAYAYADVSGVHIVTADAESFTDMTLKVLEEKTDLVRCHRQSLVHPDKIAEIKLLDGGLGEIQTRCGHTIAVSRRYLRELKERFGVS